DSISDIEASLFAIGLYKPNEISRPPFSLKLRINFRIKDDHASPFIKRLCNSSIHSLEAQLAIVRIEHHVSNLDSTVCTHQPFARCTAGTAYKSAPCPAANVVLTSIPREPNSPRFFVNMTSLRLIAPATIPPKLDQISAPGWATVNFFNGSLVRRL